MVGSRKLSIRERLIKGGAWALVGRVGAAFTLVGLQGALARMLPAEDMGRYFLIFSLVSFVAVVAQLGLPKTVVRFVAGSVENRRYKDAITMVRWALIGNALGICLVALALLGPVGPELLGQFASGEIVDAGLWIVLWAAGLSSLQLLAEVFRGLHDLRRASLFGGTISGGIALILVVEWWLLYGNASLQQALFLSVLAWGAAAGLSLLFAIRRLMLLPRTGDAHERLSLGEVVGTAWPLWFSDMFSFVLLQVDLWIVGAFCSASDMALYGAVRRFMILVALPLMLVNAVVQPMIAAAFAKGELKKIEPVLRGTTTLATILALIALVCIVFWGEWMLKILFGSFYEQAYYVLLVLTLGKAIDVLSGSCGVVLSLTGNQSSLLLVTVISCILLVLFSVWAAKSIGIVGVAWVSSGILVFQNILMMLMAKFRLGVWTAFSVKPFLAFKKG